MPNESKESVRVRLTAVQTLVKMSKKEEGTRLLKEISIESMKDAGLLSEIVSCYLEVGDKEVARKIALIAMSSDNTNAAAYLVLYKSYLEEDKLKADIWMMKYLIGSSLSVKEAQKDQKRETERVNLKGSESIGEPSDALKAHITACSQSNKDEIWNILASNLRGQLDSPDKIDLTALREGIGVYNNSNYMVAREDINGNDVVVEIVGDVFDKGSSIKNHRYTAQLVIEDNYWKIKGDSYNYYKPIKKPEQSIIPISSKTIPINDLVAAAEVGMLGISKNTSDDAILKILNYSLVTNNKEIYLCIEADPVNFKDHSCGIYLKREYGKWVYIGWSIDYDTGQDPYYDNYFKNSPVTNIPENIYLNFKDKKVSVS